MGETDIRLFDIVGAVEYLRSVGATSATVNFVRSLISAGQIAYLRIGRKFFVTRASLDKWLGHHERRSRP